MRRLTPRRFAAPALACIAAAAPFAVVAAAPAAAGAAACKGAGAIPSHASERALAAATLCVINRDRAAHGLRPLRVDGRLTRAALGHSNDMVAHRYFAHDSRSGAPFSARIAHAGWMRGRSSWMVGENLAWGTLTLATPRATVNSWMHSPPHRHNLLNRRFRLVGLGIARGVPIAGLRGGATYTADFGS